MISALRRVRGRTNRIIEIPHRSEEDRQRHLDTHKSSPASSHLLISVLTLVRCRTKRVLETSHKPEDGSQKHPGTHKSSPASSRLVSRGSQASELQVQPGSKRGLRSGSHYLEQRVLVHAHKTTLSLLLQLYRATLHSLVPIVRGLGRVLASDSASPLSPKTRRYMIHA